MEFFCEPGGYGLADGLIRRDVVGWMVFDDDQRLVFHGITYNESYPRRGGFHYLSYYNRFTVRDTTISCAFSASLSRLLEWENIDRTCFFKNQRVHRKVCQPVSHLQCSIYAGRATSPSQPGAPTSSNRLSRQSCP